MKNEIANRSVKLQDVSPAQLQERFKDFIQGSPATVRTYANAVKMLFEYLQANNIRQPEFMDLKHFIDSLKGNKAAATIQLYAVAIKKFFTWTESEGLYKNIARGLKGEKVERGHEKGYLTAEQIRIILNGMEDTTVKGKRNKAMFITMATCGLRTIEISRANIEDLQTVGGNAVLFIQGKGRTGKKEYVKLPAITETAIRDYLQARGTDETTAPLFAADGNRNAGGRMETRSISRIIKDSMKNAGYNSDRLTAHSLRHSAVTLALLSGEKIQEVQKFARHADISTTMIYVHAINAEQNTCSNTVSAAIFG